MNNERFGVPQHELNVVSSLLRDRRVAFEQLVDWGRREPQYWLRPEHFQTGWLGDAYRVLLSGGLDEIDQSLQAYPNADPAQVAADVVVQRLWTQYQQMAESGDPGARATLHDREFWTNTYNGLRQLSDASWPADPSDARHDAYVVVQAAQYPSATEGVPFQLAQGRPYDEVTQHRELSVIGAVLNDPARALQFRYTPSNPDASPYWLQPQDFGDPSTAEIWDALVTGPDPAIALPAATDPNLTPEQRTQAMVQHVYRRLWYNDYHRSGADPAAQARLENKTNQAIAQILVKASQPDFSPNPDNASLYAVNFILEPSIPAAVDALAGQVRRDGRADASLYQVAVQLSTHEHALDQLKERLDHSPRTLDNYGAAEPAATPSQEEGPRYASRDVERRVLISLIRDPAQLNDGGRVQSLAAQDFTQPEHAYLFKAIQSLPQHAAQDTWVVANQARQLAIRDQAPRLDGYELENIMRAATSLPPVPPAQQSAGHLITLTVRRTSHEASTAIAAAAQQASLDPRHLIEQSRAQVQQATHEALRYHDQSVPAQTMHSAPGANVA
ncbi:hypothetical protein [Streptomyces sp. 7N604]|uniref:hypothetical protein n=1 Tax=Streptomyces sp. 7N604 TaxID=3457415 RepID=UPI003FCEED09